MKAINIETPEHIGTRNQTSGDYTLVRNSQEEMNFIKKRPPNLYDHSPYADKLGMLSKKTDNSSIRSGLNALRKRRGNSVVEPQNKNS